MAFDMRTYQKNWQRNHRDHLLAYQRKYRRKNRKHLRKVSLKSYYKTKSKTAKYNSSHSAYVKVHRANLKRQIIEAYGQKCVCCGETMYQFLTPDHINGGGSEHLRRRGTIGIYRDIIKEGFPRDKYRILCMNCNWARSVYGICPHESTNK
jgi:hypothetical protein